MTHKIILLILTIFVFSVLTGFLVSSSYAASQTKCPQHSVFLCEDIVELLILQTFAPLIDVVGKVAGQAEVHEERITELERKIAGLEAKLTPSPSPSFTPTPTSEI